MTANSGKWLKAMTDCLAAVDREQIGSLSPVVDHELVAGMNGEPDGMQVWCICRTNEEKNAFADTELTRYGSRLRREMLHAGFSESAVASLSIRVTSREEVAANGGRLRWPH